MAEQQGGRTETGAGFRDARVHGVIGKRKVVVETATACSLIEISLSEIGLHWGRSGFIENQGHCIPPSVQPAPAGSGGRGC